MKNFICSTFIIVSLSSSIWAVNPAGTYHQGTVADVLIGRNNNLVYVELKNVINFENPPGGRHPLSFTHAFCIDNSNPAGKAMLAGILQAKENGRAVSILISGSTIESNLYDVGYIIFK